MELSYEIKSSCLPCMNRTGQVMAWITSILFHPSLEMNKRKNPAFCLTRSVNDWYGLCKMSPPTGIPFCMRDAAYK